MKKAKFWSKFFKTVPMLGLVFLSTFFNTPISFAATAVPVLPQSFVDSTYPTLPSNHTVRAVKLNCSGVANCYTSPQAAVDSAVYGDEIVLDAGSTFAGPLNLPNKSGSGWIVIRTSALSSLPSAGNRVGPSNSSQMPKIVAPGYNVPALQTELGSHNYRIVGVEFKKISSSAVTGDLIDLGINDTTQNALSSVPHDFVLDRIYAHGDSSSDLKRCVALNSGTSAIIDSYISDCHVVGQDAQAIGGVNGPGPYKIINNYLEGSGENVLFGGDDPKIANLITSDIEFRNNWVAKNPNWFDASGAYTNKPHWAVKNLFELKNASRVLIDGNIFEYNWKDGQAGYAILFTPRNQYGTCTWCQVQDITFINNIIRHSAAGFSILGHDDQNPSQLTQRIKIENNLWTDINGSAWGWGNGLWGLEDGGTAQAGPSDITLNHNTVLQSGQILTPASHYTSPDYYSTKPNHTITNNIVSHNSYGVIGQDQGVGNTTLNTYYPGVSFTKNILMGGNDYSYSSYPGNYFPGSWSGVFTNEALGDYHVPLTSSYHNAATDGSDLGANIDKINSVIANVISGSTSSQSLPSATFVISPNNIVAGETATLTWSTSNAASVSIDQGIGSVALSGSRVVSPAVSTTYALTATNQTGSVVVVASISVGPKTNDVSAPTVVSFDVQPRTTSGSVTASFSATDIGGSYLNSAELWRAAYDGSNCSETVKINCSWGQLGSITAPVSSNSWTGSISDTAPSGTYLYGIHILDNAGNVGLEPALIKVVSASSSGQLPTATLTASPTTITQGSSSILSWTSSNADSLAIDQGVGAVSSSGSKEVMPTQTTTYTITALNSQGSKTSSVQITVNPLFSLPKDGTLVKDANLSTVYVLEYGLKRPFSSMNVFKGFGYKSGNIKIIDTSSIPLGEALTTSNQRHVRGTNAKDRSGTIYFLGKDLRYPFPSKQIFLSGGNSFSEVVSANSYDLALPVGQAITQNIGEVLGLAILNNSLVKGSADTVYLLKDNILYPFTSEADFLSKGYLFSQVISVFDDELKKYYVQ